MVGAFFLFGTCMAAAAGVSLLFPGDWSAVMWQPKPHEYRQLLTFGWPAGVGFLVLAGALATASWGCFHRRRWGWALGVALIAINLAGDVARLAMGGVVEGLTGVLIAGALLWWLTRRTVRASFRQGA